MDERTFIEQKQESWTRLSQTLDIAGRRGLRALDRKRLEELGSAYRALVSDLAYARTQGASAELISYLNDLAGRSHGFLYAGGRAKMGGLGVFLLREFPRTFRANLRYVLTAAIIFFLSWGCGAYVVVTDPDTSNQFMPESVQEGKANPLSDVPDPAAMSSYIMTNNIKVGIISFAGGVTAGTLTVFAMAQNGLVIGMIATKAAPIMGHAFFWSLILPHGIIELAAIFICGGAGLMIGSSIIAPGNLRRADAVKISSSSALKLFAGSVPCFIIAAIIEGFITPSVIPIWSKLIFAGLTAISLVIYLGFAGGDANGHSPAL